MTSTGIKLRNSVTALAVATHEPTEETRKWLDTLAETFGLKDSDGVDHVADKILSAAARSPFTVREVSDILRQAAFPNRVDGKMTLAQTVEYLVALGNRRMGPNDAIGMLRTLLEATFKPEPAASTGVRIVLDSTVAEVLQKIGNNGR